MTEDMDYQTLEGKLDATNILAAILAHNNDQYSVPASLVFSNIQIDRVLELSYNEDTQHFDIVLKGLGKKEGEGYHDSPNNE